MSAPEYPYANYMCARAENKTKDSSDIKHVNRSYINLLIALKNKNYLSTELTGLFYRSYIKFTHCPKKGKFLVD